MISSGWTCCGSKPAARRRGPVLQPIDEAGAHPEEGVPPRDESAVTPAVATVTAAAPPPAARSPKAEEAYDVAAIMQASTPSWMDTSMRGTPLKSSLATPHSSVSATPQSAPPSASKVLRTPEWCQVLKSEGMGSAMISTGLREMREEDEDDIEEEAPGEEDEDSWPEEISSEEETSPTEQVDERGSQLCKIEVVYNTKMGKFNKRNQRKLYAQMIAAGTDDQFAEKVVMSLKQNKGKVSVRGPLANHGPAFDVFRSIPSLHVNLQTPSKVNQTLPPHGRGGKIINALNAAGPRAAPTPVRNGGRKMKMKIGGASRGATTGRGGHAGLLMEPPPLPSSRMSLFDRAGRPVGHTEYQQTPRNGAGPVTPGDPEATPAPSAAPTPIVSPKGVRTFKSPARLLKESCQRDAVLKGHEFQVLVPSVATRLVMPSSPEIEEIPAGTVLTAVGNAWWHGPRIKVAMPGTPYVDGVPYVTGWLSLLSERGEYNLIPVVEDVAPDGVRPVQPSEVPPANLPLAPGLRDISIFAGPRIAIRKTPGGTARAVGVKQNFSVQAAAAAAAAANAGHNKPAVRRALGLRQGANGTVPRTMPLTANPTPGREGDI